jgi:imidazoleglycerol phosphate synthase glutamine amidotransferase subunit HisH
MAMAALAAIERHPHLAQPCPDGWVRVDMHSHTMFSGDSTTTLDEIIESVVEAGIDVLCVTDYGGPFVSAIEREHVIGVQFHPEKSHKYGMKLLDNFARFY